jgi:bacterioferritin B
MSCYDKFPHWFLTEQREEVASMSDLLQVVERGRDNLLQIEEYMARAQVGDQRAPDAAMPPVAGGAL